MPIAYDAVMALRVLHLTDTHYSAGRATVFPPKSFADAIHALTGRTPDSAAALVAAHVKRSMTPDLVLHTGDIVDAATPEAYAAAGAMLHGLGAPYLITAGNHDDSALAQQAGLETRAVAVSDLGKWRVVAVCSARPGQSHGTLGTETLEALDRALAVDRPVLIGMHHPPMSTCADPDCNVSDAAAFFEVIDRHPNVVAVATGHLHVAGELSRGDVRYLLGPSTCIQLVHDHPLSISNKAATPLGARCIELADDGTLSTELLWLAADAAQLP